MQYRKTILKTCDCVVRKGKLKVLIFVFTLKGILFHYSKYVPVQS